MLNNVREKGWARTKFKATTEQMTSKKPSSTVCRIASQALIFAPAWSDREWWGFVGWSHEAMTLRKMIQYRYTNTNPCGDALNELFCKYTCFCASLNDQRKKVHRRRSSSSKYLEQSSHKSVDAHTVLVAYVVVVQQRRRESRESYTIMSLEKVHSLGLSTTY